MKNSTEEIDVETMELFGGLAPVIEQNDDEREVQLALRTVRDCLLQVAERDNVGVNQIARRLGISPSSVSRFFSNETDLRLSTAVLYARALGYLWNFTLCQDTACVARGNHSGKPEIFLYDPNLAQSSSPYTIQFSATNLGAASTIVSSPYDAKLGLKAIA